MKGLTYSVGLLLLLMALPALSDDQQKAQNLLGKVTAIAMDPNGRRAVSLAISDTVAATRAELVQRRRAMNLSYGDLFLAYYLAKGGLNLDEIGSQIKSGKTVWQIAGEKGSDFKQLATNAKKLNGEVDKNLLRHFAKQKADAERNLADGYNPILDSVKADNNVSPEQITDAQNRYIFLRDHAGVAVAGNLDTVNEKAAQSARPDPVRNGRNTDAITQSAPRK
jgi:hypothetical protein